jgi:hypothetical protein
MCAPGTLQRGGAKSIVARWRSPKRAKRAVCDRVSQRVHYADEEF